jgi:hypothetical protein
MGDLRRQSERHCVNVGCGGGLHDRCGGRVGCDTARTRLVYLAGAVAGMDAGAAEL